MWLQLECGGRGEGEEIIRPQIYAERRGLEQIDSKHKLLETKQKAEQLEVRKVGLPPLFLHRAIKRTGGGKPTFLTLRFFPFEFLWISVPVIFF